MRSTPIPILCLILLTACPGETGADTPELPATGAPAGGAVQSSISGEGALAPLSPAFGGSGRGVSARRAYEEAFDNMEDGDWYRDQDNEEAALAWGESWVMMSLTAMFRATGDPRYLERLAHQIDGVLAQRDDRRGVADYRGVSGACWRNLHYQSGREPYCYAVHSGMIGHPMVEFARLVQQGELRSETLPDGRSFGEAADAYVAAAEETVAFHEDQWRVGGTYVFREDATFFDHPGSDLPLNMASAMGRLLLVLHDVTGKETYLARATAIARRFDEQITVADDGAYLWNYGGGVYVPFGEDFPHASINVDFAGMAARRGIVFDGDDLQGFATTFTHRVYVDDQALAKRIGGGTRARGEERSQCARWLRLSPSRAGIYAAVRDVYADDWPPASVRTGGTLISWGYLAEFEPVTCGGVEGEQGWAGESAGDGWLESDGGEATLLLRPRDPAEACVWPLTLETRRRVEVEQWDGSRYREVAVWQSREGRTVRHLPYEPRWRHASEDGTARYRLMIGGRGGGALRIAVGEGEEPPSITSTPPEEAVAGQAMAYEAAGDAEGPLWWSLATFPPGARIDPATGLLSWTPVEIGSHEFRVHLRTDAGVAEQRFEVRVGTGVDQGPITPK